jgi:predicted CopG family antitoxin
MTSKWKTVYLSDEVFDKLKDLKIELDGFPIKLNSNVSKIDFLIDYFNKNNQK